jgi:Flp pilus assembly protein CpaB
MGRRTIVLVVALLLAGLAAFAVWNFLSNIEAETRGDVELVEVYRAAATIQEGAEGSLVLSQNQAVKSQEEAQFLPANAITSQESLQQALAGKLAAGPISENQVLTTDQWVTITADLKPLAEIIPEGKQAISIQVDEVRGVGGFIRPGDRVNMIVTISTPVVEVDVVGGGESTEQALQELLQQVEEAQEEEITRFVLQGLPVLAAGRDLRSESGAEEVTVPSTLPDGQQVDGAEEQISGVYTIEVSHDEAERIAYSFEKGSVWLTLVPQDFVSTPTEGITKSTLFQQ